MTAAVVGLGQAGAYLAAADTNRLVGGVDAHEGNRASEDLPQVTVRACKEERAA